MKILNSTIVVIIIAFMAILMATVSCIHEERFEGNVRTANEIQYSTRNYDVILTKSTDSLTTGKPELIYLGMLGTDSLYLHIKETEITDITTKSDPITSAPPFFYLTAYRSYTNDNASSIEKYIDELELEADAENGWTNYSPKTYWPKTYDKIHFFAHNMEGVTPTYNLGETLSASFEYITPTDIEDGDATAQHDIIFAITPSILRAEQPGVVDLNFTHILSAVRFHLGSLGDIVEENIADMKVTLSGITSSRNCMIETTENGLNVEWKEQESYNTGTFSQMISDFETFMLIPQTLDNASATIDIIIGGEPHTYSFPLTGEWERSKMYTYTITSEGYVETTVGDIQNNPDNQQTHTFPTIQNTGWTNSYIRVAITGYWSKMEDVEIDEATKSVEHIVGTWDIHNGDDASVSFNIGSGENQWTKGNDGFYYYNTILTPGAEAEPLFSSFTQESTGSIGGSTLKISIAVQAIEDDMASIHWPFTPQQN